MPSNATESRTGNDASAVARNSIHSRSPTLYKTFLTGLVAALCNLATPCHAAPEEIQVYEDDLIAPGKFGLDVHNNYVISGDSAPSYPGQLPPDHVYRLTPEFYYGLSKTLELGFYVLTTYGSGDNVHTDGAKFRIKYVAPHDTKMGSYWGLNLEVGKTDLRVSELPWNAELKGIFGYRAGPWSFALNPNLDSSLDRAGGPVTVEVDGKIAYSITEKTKVGFESYNELGPLSSLQSLQKNSKALYAVVDHDFGGFDLNAGLGRGLTSDTDRWVVKFIIGTHF
jgi:hypothetical protein